MVGCSLSVIGWLHLAEPTESARLVRVDDWASQVERMAV